MQNVGMVGKLVVGWLHSGYSFWEKACAARGGKTGVENYAIAFYTPTISYETLEQHKSFDGHFTFHDVKSMPQSREKHL